MCSENHLIRSGPRNDVKHQHYCNIANTNNVNNNSNYTPSYICLCFYYKGHLLQAFALLIENDLVALSYISFSRVNFSTGRLTLCLFWDIKGFHWISNELRSLFNAFVSCIPFYKIERHVLVLDHRIEDSTFQWMCLQWCKFSCFYRNSCFHAVKIPTRLFIFSPFWRLLAQVHALFQAFSFRSAYIPVLNQDQENLTVFGYSLIIMNTPMWKILVKLITKLGVSRKW